MKNQPVALSLQTGNNWAAEEELKPPDEFMMAFENKNKKIENQVGSAAYGDSMLHFAVTM